MTEATAITEENLFNKVPQVTIIFWLIKIMATTIGETGADYLILNLNFGLAVTSYLMGALLIVGLAIQIKTKKYIT